MNMYFCYFPLTSMSIHKGQKITKKYLLNELFLNEDMNVGYTAVASEPTYDCLWDVFGSSLIHFIIVGLLWYDEGSEFEVLRFDCCQNIGKMFSVQFEVRHQFVCRHTWTKVHRKLAKIGHNCTLFLFSSSFAVFLFKKNILEWLSTPSL